MAETVAGERWLYTVLSGDAQIVAAVGMRIYGYRAEQGKARPYILYQWQGGVDLMVVGAARVWTESTYLVRAVADETNFTGVLKTLADRIDAVLHAASGTVVDGVVVSCVREAPWSMVEAGVGGDEVRQLGGVYRLRVQ